MDNHANSIAPLPSSAGLMAIAGRQRTLERKCRKESLRFTGTRSRCRLCDAVLTGSGRLVGDALHHTPGVFLERTCPRCGLKQIAAVGGGAMSTEAYPAFYVARALGRPDGDWRQRLLNRFVRQIDRRRAELALRHAPLSPQSNVLDAGCNNGNFLRELHARSGCRCFGVEMDGEAVGRANTHPELRVEQGEINEKLPNEERYDLTTLWHVLEHLPNPLETLRRLRRATKTGGRLIVAVPDSSGYAARLFGRRWFGYDAPRHLAHFTKETLWAALTAADWRPLHWEHTVEVSTVAGSLHNLFRRRWCDDLPGNLLKWMFAQALGLSFDHLFKSLGGGDWLIFVARKD